MQGPKRTTKANAGEGLVVPNESAESILFTVDVGQRSGVI
jgi:hypothetical protein